MAVVEPLLVLSYVKVAASHPCSSPGVVPRFPGAVPPLAVLDQQAGMFLHQDLASPPIDRSHWLETGTLQ